MGLTIFFTTLVFPLVTAPQFNFSSSWQRVTWEPPEASSFVEQAYAKEAKCIKGGEEDVNACLLNYCLSQSHPKVSFEFLEKVPETGFFVLVDVNENREYVFESRELIGEYLVSTGSATRFAIPQYTPVGKWRIVEKIKTDAASEFGPYFLRLGKWDGKQFTPTSLALHGTNEPELLGKPASHGCIRHENEVITHLYQILPIGTLVETVE